jgi:hypothetical protein
MVPTAATRNWEKTGLPFATVNPKKSKQDGRRGPFKPALDVIGVEIGTGIFLFGADYDYLCRHDNRPYP